MELRNNAKENVWMEVMRTMAEKEITYKEGIHRKIAGIKSRQIASLVIASCVLLVLVSILTIAVKNMRDITLLIQTLSEAFTNLNKSMK